MKFIGLLFILSAFPILIYSQSTVDLEKKANAASEDRNYELALNYIDQAITIDSLNSQLFKQKGDFFFALKKDQEALDAYSKGISTQPNFAELYLMRGLLYLNHQMIEDAIKDFNTGLKYTNTDTVIYKLYESRGIAQCWKRNYKEGYKDLLYAYKMDTTKLSILINLANACNQINKKDEALKYMLIALKAYPEDAVLISNIGLWYQDKTDYKQSITYFDKAIKLNPNLGLGYSNRSYSRLKLGETDGALGDINKSIELFPTNSYAYRNRGLIWIKLKKYASACEDFNTAIAKGYTQMYGSDVEELIQKNCAMFK